ncbi:MAG: fused MFS/spermidine synthase [Candidatus Competibacteraceae bacterium]|jgi:spermidine synthase|nr:fused MFS/spermidine synthase [Candidatus Competibacteraceae bacterium]
MSKEAIPAFSRPVTETSRTAPSPLIHLIVMASGFAGLGYEIVWTRLLAVSLGHEFSAVLAVLAAFFGGLALGAFALGSSLRRTANPARWYAILELIIGLWAITLVWLIPIFNEAVPRWIGEQPTPLAHWGIAFSATLALLLPATAAMGATLPALERVYGHLFGIGNHVGSVYAANTFGAVTGTVLTTFVLAPALGYSLTLWVCAMVNLACAIGILRLIRGTAQQRAAVEIAATKPNTERDRRLLMILFITGLLGLSYEVLVIRVLSQVLEDTVFTFAVILSIYLLGVAIGAACYQRWLAHRDAQQLLPTLLVATVGAALLGLMTLWLADAFYEGIIQLFSHSTVSALTGEVALAFMVFLLPTIAMGALFSHLAQCAIPKFGLGQALAANTLGAAFAPLLAGVLLLPIIGAKSALLLVSLAYLALLPEWNRRTVRLVAGPALVSVALVLMPPLRFVGLPANSELLDYRDGVMAAVAVVNDSFGIRYLKVNNHFTMGSTSSTFADHRQTHIPLLLHGEPHSALFLGVGTGMSLNAAQYHPQLEVTAVELVPEVLTMMHHFGTAIEQNDWSIEPRLLASDARRFVVSSQRQFDVIVADLFHPSRDGAGSLYTREHFEAIKQRLSPGGLFCQWLPLFQMDLGTFKLIARTFADRFPYIQVVLPHFSLQQPIVGLIGSLEPLEYGPSWLQDHVLSRTLQQQLVELRLNSNLALFGGHLADQAGLTKYVGDGALNTDDHPLVTYQAPGFAYRQQQGHGERVVELAKALAESRRGPAAPTNNPEQVEFQRQLDAYWRARDAYLSAGLGIEPSEDMPTMLSQVRGPLLEVVRISSDFMPAYLPLLTMAEQLYPVDPAAARQLLVELDQAAPSRPEAHRLWHMLSGK